MCFESKVAAGRFDASRHAFSCFCGTGSMQPTPCRNAQTGVEVSLQPTVVSFSSMTSALEKSGQATHALGLLARSLAHSRSICQSVHRSTLLSSLSVTLSLSLSLSLSSSVSRSQCLSSVIFPSHAGEWPLALQLLSEMPAA